MSSVHTHKIHAAPLDLWMRRSPIFYGWVILFAGTVGMVMTSPGQTYAVSILLDPMIEQLQISRTLVSTLYMAATLIGSLALPWIGRQIDANGPRRMALLVSAAFGLSCFFMGAVANAAMLCIGFIGIRMFGQGGLSLVSQNVINQWWVRRRGFMLGISGLFMSLLGLGGFPLLIYALMESFTWRQTFVIMGVLVLAVMLPVIWLLFRDRPEVYGLRPDGMAPLNASSSRQKLITEEENWTAAEAMRTPVFWIVSAGLASGSMLSTGLFFHIVSIFADNGLDAGLAAAVFVPVALTTALVNLSSGILIDRAPVRFVQSAALLLQAISLLMALTLSSAFTASLYGIVLGATSGLQRTVAGVVWANYFGRRSLGAIAGVSTTILVAGSALGPLPFGIVHDLVGSYRPVLLGLAVVPLALAVVTLFFDKPRKPTRHQPVNRES